MVSCAYGQAGDSSSVTDLGSITDTVTILKKTGLYIDKTASMPVDAVLKQPFTPLQDFKYRKRLPNDFVPYAYYLRFAVTNTTSDSSVAYLFPGLRFREKKLYKLDRLSTPSSDEDQDGYLRLALAPGEKTDVLVYLRPVKREWISLSPKLIRSKYIESFRTLFYEDYSKIRTVGYVLSGILLMMMLFMLTNFVLNRKKEFLFNALYSLCMFALIFFNSYVLRTTNEFSNFYFGYMDLFLMVTGVVMYIYFTRYFLNTKQEYPSIDRVLRYGKQFILLLMGAFTYLHFFTSNFSIQWMLANIMKFSMLGIGIYFIIMAIRQRSRLFNYLAAGNGAMVLFGIISYVLIRTKTSNANFYRLPEFYYYVGIVLELVFFIMGLTYKNRKELIERTKQQEAFKLEAEKAAFQTEIAVIKAQQEERNRISADMHDDLGAGMTSIRLYSELAKNKLGDTPMPEIEKISSSANELLNKMNAIIWSMSGSNDTLGNMIAYIRSYALEYLENSGVDCRITIPDRIPNIEVNGKIRRNVFLVVKEALNNILKHANATKVDITMVKEANGFSLYIHDNGVGIDFEKLRQFSNGLINMKQRMSDVEIDFKIENKNGTLITLYKQTIFP